MSKRWIVVADQSKARFFTVSEPRGPLLDIGELQQPSARDKAQTLTSDRPGRSFDSAGQGHHAMGTSVEPKEQEAMRFAKQITEYLNTASNEGRCNRLLLVAGPPFLGVLRAQLDSLSNMSITEIEKNLGQFNAREIRSHLPDRL